MASEDPTTWGEVCNKVGFSDNLYSDCRKKVPGFMGGANSSFDEVPEYGPGAPDFNKQLAASALALPPPPPADWQPEEEEGFLGGMPLNKILMYGGVAALIWLLLSKQKAASTDEPKTVPEKVTTPKAA